MNEYDNPNELPREDARYEVISNRGKPNQGACYGDIPDTPAEYRYVPEPKKKKRKRQYC